MQAKHWTLIAFLSLVTLKAWAQAATAQQIETGDFVIIRAVTPEEAFQPNFKLLFGKSRVFTRLTGMSAGHVIGRGSSELIGRPLSPGAYQVEARCTGSDGKSSYGEKSVIANQRGYEYLVECLRVTGTEDTLVSLKQTISSGSVVSEIREARDQVIGRWRIFVDFPDATGEGEITISEAKGTLIGKLTTSTWSGDARVAAQRRGLWFETRWTVGGRHESSQFVAEFVPGGLTGEAMGATWASTWKATKLQ